jgi:23S rRNA pseudouridine955/2504/2580 synthase
LQTYSIIPDEAGQRLDKYIHRLLPALPMSRIFKLIRTGHIKLNRRKKEGRTLVQTGDQVAIFLAEPDLAKAAVPEKHKFRDIRTSEFYKNNLDIIFQDDNLLVLNKHPDTVVHTGSGYNAGRTLMDVAKSYWGQDKFLSLVHRLDRDTSGVLVFALNRQTMMEASRLFRGHKIRKVYLALSAGRPPAASGKIEKSLVKITDHFQHRVIVSENNPAALKALTLYKVIQRLPGYVLLEAEPATGRTHQIRVHLASIGCPVLGDETYGDPAANLKAREQFNLTRQFLHCRELEINLSSYSVPLLFEAPLSQDLAEVLKKIPKSS